jgi:hypothetical protein
VRWSHWLLSHAASWQRDDMRLRDLLPRVGTLPLGSGARGSWPALQGWHRPALTGSARAMSPLSPAASSLLQFGSFNSAGPHASALWACVQPGLQPCSPVCFFPATGALAGNPFGVDRRFLSSELGFEGRVCPNSMDAGRRRLAGGRVVCLLCGPNGSRMLCLAVCAGRQRPQPRRASVALCAC